MTLLRTFSRLLLFPLLWISVGSAQVTFTTIDVPGAVFTGVEGINSAGDMVGYYQTTGGGPVHAFVLRGGNFAFFDHPRHSSTWAFGINDAGLIVGGADGIGFLYDGTRFRPIRYGNSGGTTLYGINNTGVAVGSTGSADSAKGIAFLRANFKDLTFPWQGTYSAATGVNDFGEIVGWSTGGIGFVFRHGKFRKIAKPGALFTAARGINGDGVIIGWYSEGSSILGFALIGGEYFSFGYPGSLYTLPRGINASGQVVGEYTFDNSTYHGFVSSPINPANLEQR